MPGGGLTAYPRAAVFFLIDTRDRRPERPSRRVSARVPAWLAQLAVLVVVAFVSPAVISVIAWFAVACLLIDRALPSVSHGGLRDHRQ